MCTAVEDDVKVLHRYFSFQPSLYLFRDELQSSARDSLTTSLGASFCFQQQVGEVTRRHYFLTLGSIRFVTSGTLLVDGAFRRCHGGTDAGHERPSAEQITKHKTCVCVYRKYK